ncbi:hypothetical protein BDR22DRAFT_156623 [Usnea florida]
MIPFGFSVGDFIAGINLLIDAIHSLSDTNGAQADYEGLGRQLSNLKNGFECIESLDLDATQIAQVSAVDTALSDCRLCIDDFTRRNSRFKSLETPSGEQWTLAALKRQGRKVQWALWKKADVAKFGAAIQLHSDAVQMLLASIQIKQIEAQGKLKTLAEQKQKSLTQKVYGRVSDLSLQQQRMEAAFEEGQTSLAQVLENQCGELRNEVQVHGRNQGKALIAQNATTIQIRTEIESISSRIGALSKCAKSQNGDSKNHMLAIIENQQQLMGQLRDIELMIRVNQDVPPQVLLSKPVVLLDACGRYTPFHLELIDTAEFFIEVLKIRFKDIGLHKIEAREFSLEDSKSKCGLQLAKPWTVIMRPGRHISMSMVFRLEERQTARCPGCGEENAGSDLEDIECGNTMCGITYRKIVEKPGSEPQLQHPNQANPSTNYEMQYYTRLHIVIQGGGNFDSMGNFTADEKVEQRKSREDKPSVSPEDWPHTPSVPVSMSVPEIDRWAQLRKNAAERAQRRNAEKTSRVSKDNMEDGEENAESESPVISTTV